MEKFGQEMPDFEAQERAKFDEVFGVDVEKDRADLKKTMRRFRKDELQFGRLGDEYNYESDKKRGWLKYSEEQIEKGQWDENDLKLAIENLRASRIDEYFTNIAFQYEQSAPIPNSIVRLDQEAAAAAQLRNGMPVLIRGNWRMGKTSLAKSLETHQFGRENSLFVDAAGEEACSERVNLDDFVKKFCLSDVAQFIAKKELPGADFKKQWEKTDELLEQIEAGQQPPFEYLNSYLKERDEKVFLSLDEVIRLARQPEKLKYVASLKNLSQLQLAVVLHRYHAFEDSFKDLFAGFQTHFIRPLTQEEVGLIARKPLEGTPVKFTDEAIQKIFEFTGGRPMEVNNLCYALMYGLSKHKKQRFTYRKEDLEELINNSTWELREIFRVAIDNYWRIYSRSMSDEERSIIDRLVKTGEIPFSETDAEKVQPLIDTTFVVKNESQGVYRINGLLFKRVMEERALD